MFNQGRILASVASLLCFHGAVGAAGPDRAVERFPILLAQAVMGDVRQEDRREDRQADRREDRRQDDNAVQNRLDLPRSADGSVDIVALQAALDANFAAGLREVQIRGGALTQQEARDLFLALDSDQNLLRQIGDLMPTGNGEWTVRFRGEVDARVQRKPDGSLRLRVEDINLAGMSDAERAALAQQLAQQTGFDRVRIAGVNGDGKRVRTEFRADRGLVQNVVQGSGNLARGGGASESASQSESQPDSASGQRREDRRGERQGDRREDGSSGRSVERTVMDRSGRGGVERAERPQRVERAERPERTERPERNERPERVERPENNGGGRGRS